MAYTADDIKELDKRIEIPDDFLNLLLIDIGAKIKREGLRRGNNYITLTVVIR